METQGLTALIHSLLPFLLMGGLLALAIVFVYFDRQRRQQAWTELAGRTGLSYEPGQFLRDNACIVGNYRGYDLRFDLFMRRRGKHSQTYTRIALALHTLTNLKLELQNEGVFDKVGKMLGGQDIQTGDEELDRRFIIKGQPEDAITALLTAGDLRSRLLQARPFKLKLDGQQLYYEQYGEERDIDYLQSMFTLMSDLAAAVDRSGGNSIQW